MSASSTQPFRTLDRILASPLSSRGLVSCAVGLVDVGNLRNKRVVGVRVCQHRADGKEDFADGQSRAPLVTQNVQADASIRVDVGVVNAGGEVDLGRLEGVVGREMNGEEEDAARVRGLSGAHDGRLPVKQIFADRTSRARRGRITAEISELLVDALKSHDEMCCGVSRCEVVKYSSSDACGGGD